MKVGIVGAGISGVVAGAHLGKANIDYTVFERSGAPGGIWSEQHSQIYSAVEAHADCGQAL